MRRLRIALLVMLLIVWPSGLDGQESLTRGDTLVAPSDGFFITADQFLDLALAVDSLDYWREVASAEEAQKRKWKDLYFRLDSLYDERDAVSAPADFGVRDAGLWSLMGAAAAIVVHGVLEDK